MGGPLPFGGHGGKQISQLTGESREPSSVESLRQAIDRLLGADSFQRELPQELCLHAA